MVMFARENYGMKFENTRPNAMDTHFSKIAKKYRQLRTTDSEPVSVIIDKIKNLNRIEAVDVGCGAGRYDLLLFKHLGEKLNLTCLDANAEMLKSLEKYLKKQDIRNFSATQSLAENMPFHNSSLDCVCTFNAVHHFSLPDFLAESARVVKSGGYIFIYTRLREQNEKNIWGLYFPGFNEKETRLYTMDMLKESIAKADGIAIESIVFFAYSRSAALEELLERAESHHYSTFSLYSPAELKEALKGFSFNISSEFEDSNRVCWFDENILFIIKKESSGTEPKITEQKASVDYLQAAAAYRPPGFVV
jgi:ubiquinone/menaquinone biosynthesis C-methylase UbiE